MNAHSVSRFVGSSETKAAKKMILDRVPSIMGRTVVKPLGDLAAPWVTSHDEVGRTDKGFFGLIGTTCHANREAGVAWDQPLLQERGGPGFLGLVTYRRPDGKRLYLAHICSEPGNEILPYKCQDEAEQSRLVTEGFGPARTARDGSLLVLTTAALRPLQASMTNIAKHAGGIPLIALITSRIASMHNGDTRLAWSTCEDGGRYKGKVNNYCLIELDPSTGEVESVNQALLAGPTAAGGRANAWNPLDFVWVDDEVLDALMSASQDDYMPQEAPLAEWPSWTNPFLIAAAGQAARRLR